LKKRLSILSPDCRNCGVLISALLFVLHCSAGTPADVAIERSGAIEKGDLKSYASDVCQIGSATLQRKQIEWIGLAAVDLTPPALKDSTDDEAYLRDGSVRTGHLIEINSVEVALQAHALKRANVAWIHLSDVAPAPSLSPSPSPNLSGNCTFWVGQVKSEESGKRGSIAEPGKYVTKTIYHVVLREETPTPGTHAELLDGRSVNVHEIRLINAGSLVEGKEDESVTGPQSYYHTMGYGYARVFNPGSNFGSVGFLNITEAGKRLEYRFTMEADFGTLFPTTTHGVRGTPPQPYDFDSHHGFLMVGIGHREDPQVPRRVSADGRVMEGNYTVRDAEGAPAEKTFWKLRATTASCGSPPHLDAPGRAMEEDLSTFPIEDLGL
jgi:hypothetical protein